MEDVIRLGKYKPEEYSVITTGDANIMRSLELPAIRGAICYSQEAPLYKPLLAAYAGGDSKRAEELAAYIGKGRAITGGLNSELGATPPASPTAVSISAASSIDLAGHASLHPATEHPKPSLLQAQLPNNWLMAVQVYSITAQKAVASHVGEGNLGPCRLPLTTLPEEHLRGLLAEYLPLLEPMGSTHSGARM